MEDKDWDLLGEKQVKGASALQQALTVEIASDRYFAALFVLGLGNGYENYIAELEHAYLAGTNSFLEFLEKAYRVSMH